MKITFTAICIFLSLGAGANAFALSSLKAPCAPDLPNAPDSNETQPLKPCSVVIPELTANLEAVVSKHVENLYNGKSVDVTDSEVDQGCSSSSEGSLDSCNSGGSFRFVKPVCSVTANPFNQNRTETTTNHKNEACGTATHVNVRISGSRAQVTYDSTGAKGTRELSYYGGAYVQAISCFKEQVKKELENNRGLNRISTACQTLASDINGLVTDYGAVSDAVNEKLKNELKNQKNIMDIWKCEVETWDTSGQQTGGAVDVGPLRQSAQHLCASRAATQAMYNQLVACEVFARASTDFMAVFGNLDQTLRKLDREIGGPCSNSCRSRCESRCRSQCIRRGRLSASCARSCGSSCGTSCANECARDRLVPFLQSELRRWPNDGNCRAGGP